MFWIKILILEKYKIRIFGDSQLYMATPSIPLFIYSTSSSAWCLSLRDVVCWGDVKANMESMWPFPLMLCCIARLIWCAIKMHRGKSCYKPSASSTAGPGFLIGRTNLWPYIDRGRNCTINGTILVYFQAFRVLKFPLTGTIHGNWDRPTVPSKARHRRQFLPQLSSVNRSCNIILVI